MTFPVRISTSNEYASDVAADWLVAGVVQSGAIDHVIAAIDGYMNMASDTSTGFLRRMRNKCTFA